MDRKRCLVAWWGALARGGETIGDLYAVIRACRLAQEAGYEVNLATSVTYRELRGFACVGWDTLMPAEVDLLMFVCGPLIGESAAFTALTDRYAGVPSVAAGVSVLTAADGTVWNPFDVTLARDGVDPGFGDLAGFRPRTPQVTQEVRRIGLCLRNAQREYGEAASLHGAAAELARSATDRFAASVVELDTRLHGRVEEAEAIERAFAAVDMVITTRMHGALLALAMGKPTLVIDQVRNGAKVSAVVGGLGWPVLPAGVATDADVGEQLHQLSGTGAPRRIAGFQRRAAGRLSVAEAKLLDVLRQFRAA